MKIDFVFPKIENEIGLFNIPIFRVPPYGLAVLANFATAPTTLITDITVQEEGASNTRNE